MHTQLLMREYIERKARNSSYSERAFARDVGLSAGFLKLLFQGKKRLGHTRALEIARKLGWSERQIGACMRSTHHVLQPEQFFELSDWFHFAIVESLKAPRPPRELSSLARRLGISVTEARYSLEKLLALGMVEKSAEGKYLPREEYEAPPISHEAVKKYHRQTLAKAVRAIDEQASDRREMRALTLAFDPDRLEEAKESIRKFVSAFERRFSTGERSAVYQMNVTFVQMDQSPKRRKE